MDGTACLASERGWCMSESFLTPGRRRLSWRAVVASPLPVLAASVVSAVVLIELGVSIGDRPGGERQRPLRPRQVAARSATVPQARTPGTAPAGDAATVGHGPHWVAVVAAP